METLSGRIDIDVLAKIYDVMGDAEPNLNSYAFAALPDHQHFALKMDTLL